jgi:2-keto-3-deoxy-L-rhamnonate aldolase RhmA
VLILHGTSVLAQAPSGAKIYNTVKQKLLEGKDVIGTSIYSPDPNIYCAVANSGYDFLWIEMQHSPLSYSEVARMIWACRGAQAIPFVRIPDATESEIQKATDIGILGLIVPTVETAEKARAAVKWAKYPPLGSRSQGNGQASSLWGSDYRQTANDNIMVVVMIESPAGVDNMEQIAAVPGVDVIFVGSGDLGSFSGFRQNDARYEALVTKIRDTTLKAGLKLGGPQNWKETRKGQGYTFFQGGGGGGGNEVGLIGIGAQVSLGQTPPANRQAK